ncbi:MAG: cardiolipin synthase [Spirochaetaceae bacterium]|jgi:cardiolipin synthase|nr:cardiolipin synthase [Spirochaetaceae bacterium]
MENRYTAKQWVRVLFRRRVFVIVLLLVQTVFLITLIAGTSITFNYVNWALNILSIVVSLNILNKKEKAAYKLTWIFLILMVPLFGGIMYIFFRSQSNPRKLRRLIEAVSRECRPLYGLSGDVLPSIAEQQEDCLPQIRYLQKFAGFPAYAHTRTEYFDDGLPFFHRILEKLEKAERYIFMEFFILRQGKMFDPILDIMEQKAKAGLDVRILYDDVGCFMSLPPDFKQQLERRGIKCVVFNRFKPILSSEQNNRDHRKIISIDGKAAFTGGMNLADEYINAYERYGHWKDAAILLEGEAAWSLTLIFLQMWNLGQKKRDDYARFYPWAETPCTVESDGYVQPYADSPVDDENVGEHVYIRIINNAKRYVYINTPYLVVDDNLLSALTLAAKSGVDVRIITPHRWDKKVVQITSQSYYRQLILAGVKVYEYSNGFNHSKTFVSDDKVATVGTTNLDFRSLYLHFEVGVCVYNNRAVGAVKEDFLRTIPISQEITLVDCARNMVQRFVQDVLRLFAPLM